MQKIGAHHVSLALASQSIPCPTLALRKPAVITRQLPDPPALHDALINPALIFSYPVVKRSASMKMNTAFFAPFAPMDSS
jgi:hypothetical protein